MVIAIAIVICTYICIHIFIYQPYHMPYQWHIYSLNTPSPAAQPSLSRAQVRRGESPCRSLTASRPRWWMKDGLVVRWLVMAGEEPMNFIVISSTIFSSIFSMKNKKNGRDWAKVRLTIIASLPTHYLNREGWCIWPSLIPPLGNTTTRISSHAPYNQQPPGSVAVSKRTPNTRKAFEGEMMVHWQGNYWHLS